MQELKRKCTISSKTCAGYCDNEVEDVHKWRFEASDQLSTKSAYEAFFHRAVQFQPTKLIWAGTWDPRKLIWPILLSLSVQENTCHCWRTADRLARRGLPHLVRNSTPTVCMCFLQAILVFSPTAGRSSPAGTDYWQIIL